VNLPDSVDEVDAAMLKNKNEGKGSREYEAVVSVGSIGRLRNAAA
jgi:hypothetical protein